jgi:hypothetical protein
MLVGSSCASVQEGKLFDFIIIYSNAYQLTRHSSPPSPPDYNNEIDESPCHVDKY